MASSSSSSSSTNMIPQNKYDVFLSFRGEDTRDNFTSHLYSTLRRKQITTFIDNQLIRGDEISQSLLNAIEGSSISIIIFSEGYASSAWCLDELLKILDCKNKYGQVVIPIFYRIDPSDVRNQTGVFGDSFSKVQERFKDRLEKLQKWNIALRDAANLSGFDSLVIRPESALIQEIVEEILKRLNDILSSNKELQLFKGLVGVETRLKQIESLLSSGSIDVYTLGIWGIGGIGKTTIADVIFNKMFSHFDSSCFILNVREESEKINGLVYLRRKLCSTLLDDTNLTIDIPDFGLSSESRRLSRKKVLIILDDVSHVEQVESLIGSTDSFMAGSLIVITTRNKQALRNCGVKKVYHMKELANPEAVKLFSQHAFRQNHLKVGYEKMSDKVIQYAGGVPLSLKVLGRLLHGRSKGEWESAINKLKRIPHMDIQKIFKISYDGLDDEEKNIFLDIACFLKGENKDFAIQFFDACGFSAEIGISVLMDKCLINISNNMITMHELLQETGREIVRQESVNNPGKRSRLWHPQDISEVLTCNTGTKTIEGISLDMSKVEEIPLNSRVFRKMRNLRFLKFYGRNKLKLSEFCLPEFAKVSYLHWNGYPLKSLFIRSENLVSLRLTGSNVEQLWDGTQNLVKLKQMDLSDSEKLKKLPDLSKARNLECLRLQCCLSLVEIHSSIQYLNKLSRLNLVHCKNLKILPKSIYLESLDELDLSGCSNLKRLPEFSSCNLKKLRLCGTAIEELPSSIECLSRLVTLNLLGCPRLEQLPRNLCQLKSLEELDLSCCLNLKRLPELSCNLKELRLCGAGIEELPTSIECLSRLVRLNLLDCSRLEQLPRNLFKLKSHEDLSLTGCSNLQRLTDELGNLKALKYLSVEGSAIREVPPSVVCILDRLYFGRSKCQEHMGFLWPISLSLPSLRSLTSLTLNSCGITKLPESLGQLSLLEDLLLNNNNFERIPESIVNISKLKNLDISYCRRLQSLPKLPCTLERMNADYCVSLEALSGLSNLFNQRQFYSHYNSIRLCNCIKVDWNELREILEDALQKIQGMTAAWWKESYPYDEYYRGGWIFYPGSEIPPWFKIQSMGSFVNLKLPPTDRFSNKLAGFAFCVVVSLDDHHKSYRCFNLFCKWKVKTEDGDRLITYSLPLNGMGINMGITYAYSDHVLFGYHLSTKFPPGFGEYGCNNEAFLEFYLEDFTVDSGKVITEWGIHVIKKCGIHFLYTQDFGESMKDRSRSFSGDDKEQEENLQPKRLKYSTSSF